VLSEVDELKLQPEIGEELGAQLKREFKQVLVDLYGGDPAARDARRRTLALPPDDWQRAWCLQGSTSAGGTVSLRWRGRHTGDYNLDGLVTVADLTPLGFHFNKSPELDADGLPVKSGDNEWAAEVDGNVDGLIAVSDLTPIGANYQSRLIGYRVYLGTGPDAGSIVWDSEFQPNADDSGLPFSVPFNTSRDAGDVQLYSFTLTPDPPATGELNYVRVVSWDGEAEGTAREMALYDGPHATLYCEICHVMPTLAFRETDNTCNLCHAAPPEDSQAAWTDAPMPHQSCLNCHEQHVFSIDPPQTPCGTCHSTIASDVQAAGMPNCLGCHGTPHIPNPQPAATDCQGCHTAPPDVPEADWAEAPGLHSSCLACHSEHEFAIAAPNSVCADCHQALIDGGHAGGSEECLGCHSSPHIPETAATGLNCVSCHPNPPENTAAEWADAPGNHAQCVLCHDTEEHGSKPVPPESICGNCHAALISGGHAGGESVCLSCHEYPHLPVMSFPNCLDCHPAPPEDPSASWDDAPGQHSACDQCHASADHGDKPVPPESICGDCHAALISAGHAGGDPLCLACHEYAHLPVMSFDNCLDCHPTPPEDPSASWDDAPGLHADCDQCHFGPEHGDKPEPPESICADCHLELINEGHAGGSTDCLGCHDFVHLPLKPEDLHDIHLDEEDVGCSDCHGMHGGTSPDREKCLACHEEQAEHYPDTECIDCHEG
jgi:hypothetical protein